MTETQTLPAEETPSILSELFAASDALEQGAGDGDAGTDEGTAQDVSAQGDEGDPGTGDEGQGADEQAQGQQAGEGDQGGAPVGELDADEVIPIHTLHTSLSLTPAQKKALGELGLGGLPQVLSQLAKQAQGFQSEK